MPKKTFQNLPLKKRKRIEAVAIDEFAERSFTSASISAIVAKAGIAKGSFYQYFEGKEDLYLHIVKLSNQEKGALVREVGLPGNPMDTFGYLRWMLQVGFLFELRFPKLAKITYQAFVEDLPFLKDEQGNPKGGGTFYFNDVLSQGIVHEDVAPWVDTNMASYIIASIYHHFGPYLLRRLNLTPEDFGKGRLDIFEDQLVQDLFDNLLDILSAGIARDPEIRNHFFSKTNITKQGN